MDETQTAVEIAIAAAHAAAHAAVQAAAEGTGWAAATEAATVAAENALALARRAAMTRHVEIAAAILVDLEEGDYGEPWSRSARATR